MFSRFVMPFALAASVTLGAGAAQADSFRYVREGVHLNARSGPGTGYASRQVLAPGTRITLVQQIGNWAQIRTPEGLLLWVFATYLLDQAPQVKAQPQPQPKPQMQPQPKPQVQQQQKQQPKPQVQQQQQPKPQMQQQQQQQPKPQIQQQQQIKPQVQQHQQQQAPKPQGQQPGKKPPQDQQQPGQPPKPGN